MDEVVIAIGGLVVGLFGGLWLGSSAYDAAWQRDCEKLGAHVSAGVVYECKKKPN